MSNSVIIPLSISAVDICGGKVAIIQIGSSFTLYSVLTDIVILSLHVIALKILLISSII